MEKEQHAWISEKMAHNMSSVPQKPSCEYHYAIYLNKAGEEVKVNLVSDNDDHGTHWDDMTYCGKVVKFVRNE